MDVEQSRQLATSPSLPSSLSAPLPKYQIEQFLEVVWMCMQIKGDPKYHPTPTPQIQNRASPGGQSGIQMALSRPRIDGQPWGVWNNTYPTENYRLTNIPFQVNEGVHFLCLKIQR